MTTPLRWLCSIIASHMHAADASYPNPRLAAWVRKNASLFPTERSPS